jgi:hypothetical protein
VARRLVEHALNKSYPYEVSGTAEFSSSTDAQAGGDPQDSVLADDMVEYPAGVSSNTTYMTEDYALGTTTHEFHNGDQTNSFHWLLRRNPNEKPSLRNARAVYTKYIVKEKKPGQSNTYERMSCISPDYALWDEGRKMAYQHKQTAMVLYKPKRFGRLQVTSLKLSIILPCAFSEPDEIWLGNRRLKELTGESVEPCPVYVKDGAVYYIKNDPMTMIAAWTTMEDSVNIENGCLWVMLGTQKLGLLPHGAVKNIEEHDHWTDETEGVDTSKQIPVIMEKGDILFFSELLIHSSNKNRSKDRWRRSYVCHYIREDSNVLHREDLHQKFPLYLGEQL